MSISKYVFNLDLNYIEKPFKWYLNKSTVKQWFLLSIPKRQELVTGILTRNYTYQLEAIKESNLENSRIGTLGRNDNIFVNTSKNISGVTSKRQTESGVMDYRKVKISETEEQSSPDIEAIRAKIRLIHINEQIPSTLTGSTAPKVPELHKKRVVRAKYVPKGSENKQVYA